MMVNIILITSYGYMMPKILY